MKAKYPGRIVSVTKDADSENVKVEIGSVYGKVDTNLVSAKDTKITATIWLKPVIANEIKIGSLITINITDELPNDN